MRWRRGWRAASAAISARSAAGASWTLRAVLQNVDWLGVVSLGESDFIVARLALPGGGEPERGVLHSCDPG